MPTTHPAGDTYSELVSPAQYPASAGWTLKMRITPRVSGSPIDVTAVAEGDSYRLTASAAITAGWGAGVCTWVQWVELGAESYTVASGQITITPNLRTLASGTDTRSQAQRALDDYRAAFAAWTPTKRRYRIGDREMEFNTTGEILTAIAYWEREVEREARTASTTSTAATQGGRFYFRRGVR